MHNIQDVKGGRTLNKSFRRASYLSAESARPPRSRSSRRLRPSICASASIIRDEHVAKRSVIPDVRDRAGTVRVKKWASGEGAATGSAPARWSSDTSVWRRCARHHKGSFKLPSKSPPLKWLLTIHRAVNGGVAGVIRGGCRTPESE